MQYAWYSAGYRGRSGIIAPAARCLVAVAAGLVLLTAFSGPGIASQWKGSELDKDGTLHVMNPAEGIEKPETLKPEKLWQVGGDDDEDILFGVLTEMASDNEGNLYVLDAQLNEVMIFSPGGEYLRSVGREGQGPGEFRRPTDLFLTGTGDIAVLQRMPGKIVLLTPDGEPAGNYPVPEHDGMRMFSGGRRAGDDIILSVQSFKRKDTGFETDSQLIRLDASGKQTATYYTRSSSRDFANMVFDEKTMMGALVWATDQEGRVYTSDNFDAYTISVWNPDGTLDRIIEREYTSRKRSKEEMEQNAPRVRFRRRGGRTEQPETRASKTDRDIQQLFARDGGTLWVLSSHGGFSTAEGTLATFDVYDRQGRFTRQVSMLGEGSFADDGFHIVKDRLYVVTGLRSAQRAMRGASDEDEEEIAEADPMSVICYDLSPIVQTLK